MQTPPPRDWITAGEAAHIGGYTDSAVLRQAILRGAFRAQKAGHTWLIYMPDYLRWLDECAYGPRGPRQSKQISA
jgi:hypothetical protein